MVLLLSQKVRQYLLKNPLREAGQEVIKESTVPTVLRAESGLVSLEHSLLMNSEGVGERWRLDVKNKLIQMRKQRL